MKTDFLSICALTALAQVVTAAPYRGAKAPRSTPAPSSSISGNGWGIAYDPYNADGSCKSQDQVSADIAPLAGYGYSLVRIYGTDCNQASTVLTACMANSLKLFAGIYDVSQVSSETQTLIDAVGSNWNYIDTVAIGNEAVNDGSASVSEVVAAIGTAKGMLQGAGYSGPVVTVDVYSTIIANPELCQASDYAAANAHPFFDASVSASGAGAFVQQQLSAVSQACGGMQTVITETGWPSQGEANGAAQPSQSNQQTAISSIQSSVSPGSAILFEAYNGLWKPNTAATFDAEQWWGIYGTSQN